MDSIRAEWMALALSDYEPTSADEDGAYFVCPKSAVEQALDMIRDEVEYAIYELLALQVGDAFAESTSAVLAGCFGMAIEKHVDDVASDALEEWRDCATYNMSPAAYYGV
jgi:hypothetical protein